MHVVVTASHLMLDPLDVPVAVVALTEPIKGDQHSRPDSGRTDHLGLGLDVPSVRLNDPINPGHRFIQTARRHVFVAVEDWRLSHSAECTTGSQAAVILHGVGGTTPGIDPPQPPAPLDPRPGHGLPTDGMEGEQPGGTGRTLARTEQGGVVPHPLEVRQVLVELEVGVIDVEEPPESGGQPATEVPIRLAVLDETAPDLLVSPDLGGEQHHISDPLNH